MNCNDVERWLDDGMPEREAAPARSHAATCARCGAALAAMLELDALLDAPLIANAPEGFTERVMSRVARVDAMSARSAVPLASPFAWWVRIAAEPAPALALLLAGLTLWKANALLSFASSLTTWTAAGVARAAATSSLLTLPDLLSRPAVLFGLALAVAPAAAWASWVLFAWTERMVLLPVTRGARGERRKTPLKYSLLGAD
jgi:hypothetical protein